MKCRKKLIEVALPLEAINREAVRENFIYRGNPSAVHKWWAQRPLAACRAVLFASLVDDPSSHPEEFPTEEEQQKERQRLFRIIEELVKWENSNNEAVLNAARAEILKSTNGHPPPVLDPFCGGGSIPLEAQRLGLEAHASDLNPVAVLITKALIEIPPKFAGKPPFNPEARKKLDHSKTWHGAEGLTQDVRYYGKWMRDEAEKRIGHLYPKVKLPSEHDGGEATVIAWLWTRTVKCPNPACGAQMPLVRSFALSTRRGKETHVTPIVEGNKYRFTVKTGAVPPPGTIGRRGAKCVCCGSPAELEYIRSEAKAGRMHARLLAVVANGKLGRTYLSPDETQEQIALAAKPQWVPETELPERALGFRVQAYGMRRHADLFTSRQLVALTTFCDLLEQARVQIERDAAAAGLDDDPGTLGGRGIRAQAYADCVATYLAFAVDKTAEYNCTIVPWYSKEDRPKGIFARQAVPMVWDYAEVNPLGNIGGTFEASAKVVSAALEGCYAHGPLGQVRMADVAAIEPGPGVLISTDPPYYDNIGYADLSDFFYAWLRPMLKDSYGLLTSTIQVPKAEELVATPFRFDGDKEKAHSFFENGLRRAFERLRRAQNPAYPLTVYYAFKQAETNEADENGSNNATPTSTGWETLLEGLLTAGFSIHGTWPMRTERSSRSVGLGTNALASSVVLVCRPRFEDAPLATRREFLNALKTELPTALKNLQSGNIAPVDLAQAAIGPGMAIYTRYSKVVDAEGKPLAIREALGLINQTLDEVLAEQEGDFDADTRWALAWFEQSGFADGEYGVAETLSKAKNTSVSGLEHAGILKSKAGKVRLLRPDELSVDWDPRDDSRLTVWEAVHHLIRRLEKDGESSAAELVSVLGGIAETARELAYRLYTICERKKRAQEALSYNGLVQSWPEITRLAREGTKVRPQQARIFS